MWRCVGGRAAQRLVNRISLDVGAKSGMLVLDVPAVMPGEAQVEM